jgi:hypothetical protein
MAGSRCFCHLYYLTDNKYNNINIIINIIINDQHFISNNHFYDNFYCWWFVKHLFFHIERCRSN